MPLPLRPHLHAPPDHICLQPQWLQMVFVQLAVGELYQLAYVRALSDYFGSLNKRHLANKINNSALLPTAGFIFKLNGFHGV